MDKNSKIDAPENSSKAGQAVSLNLVDLSQELNRTEHNFHKSRDTQGVLGSSYDWMKNNLGGSYETGSWIGRRWSNVLNYDMGSDGIQKNIDRTKQLIGSGDLDKIARASEIADGRINLRATNTAKEYNNDQRLGVNLLADTATFAAVALTRGKGIIDLAVRGAVVKSGLKAVDGSYSKPLDDAATGAFIGVMTPFAGALGRGAGMVAETAPAALQSRAVSAVRFGTEGAVLGHTQQISSLFEQKRVDGERAGQAFWKANLDSVANPTGAVLGFAGGAVGGFLFGKARIAQSEVPEAPSPSNPPINPRSPLAPASRSAEVELQIPKSPNGPFEPIEPSSGPYPKRPTGGGGGTSAEVGLQIPKSPIGPIEPIEPIGPTPRPGGSPSPLRQAAALEIPKSPLESPIYLIESRPPSGPRSPLASGAVMSGADGASSAGSMRPLNPSDLARAQAAADAARQAGVGANVNDTTRHGMVPPAGNSGREVRDVLQVQVTGGKVNLSDKHIADTGKAGEHPAGSLFKPQQPGETFVETFLEKFASEKLPSILQLQKFASEYVKLTDLEQLAIQRALKARNSELDRRLLRLVQTELELEP